MKKAKSYNERKKSNKVKKQEKHLPLLILTEDICRDLYSDKLRTTTRHEKLGMRGLGNRLERDLLRIPEFQPPYTTADKPARLLSYEVVPEPDERGVFTAFIEFLPGYKADEYCFEQIRSKVEEKYNNATEWLNRDTLLEAMGLGKVDLAELGLANFDFASQSIDDGLEEFKEKVGRWLRTKASEKQTPQDENAKTAKR